MTSRSRSLCLGIACAAAVLLWGAPASAQNEAALRSAFEGQRVTLKIDMPATSDGVDLRVETPQPLNFREYNDRIRSTGVAIRSGQSAAVTLVRLKKDLIEFHLDGGGFHYESTSVYIPHVDKSNREKQLEKDIKTETDAGRRRAMQRELDDLVSARDRENARIDRERARLEEQKKERIASQRLTAGSRFNLRYNKSLPEGLRAADIRAALAPYVEFASAAPASAPAKTAPAPRPTPATGSVRKGMTIEDAERELGAPAQTNDHREGTLAVTTLVFIHGEQRITADFVEGVLVRYTIASK